MSDRRDFLKLFGVGAMVVPIIGGVPAAFAESKLLDAPRVELAEPSMVGDVKSFDPFLNAKSAITIIMDHEDGKRITLSAGHILMEFTNEVKEFRDGTFRNNVRHVLSLPRKIRWKASGEFLQDEKGILYTLSTED